MPDSARLWIFGSSRPLPDADAAKLLEIVDGFVRGWAAHGHPVVGARDWRHDHFLLVAADEEATGVSGCSIDSLFRSLKATERELGISLLDGARIWFRDEAESVRVVTRGEFRRLVAEGEIGAGTVVFDNTVGTVGAVRAGDWEKPFETAWHSRAFSAAAG